MWRFFCDCNIYFQQENEDKTLIVRVLNIENLKQVAAYEIQIVTFAQ